jgi:hypothetical protein
VIAAIACILRTMSRPARVFAVLVIAMGGASCKVGLSTETCASSMTLGAGASCETTCTVCAAASGVCAAPIGEVIASGICRFGTCREGCSSAKPTCSTGICCVVQVRDPTLADSCGTIQSTACVPAAECEHPAALDGGDNGG